MNSGEHTMHDDDRPVGCVLSRREALALLGGSGVAVLIRCAGHGGPAARAATGNAPLATAGSCAVRPEMTIGPFFVDERLKRSDVRADPATGRAKPGAPLQLTFNVSRAGDACEPLPGAMVDIWHCDAAGLYSDEEDNGTEGQKFLRGYQVTDANGIAHFTTIYPGWYRGRTVHIHFRIRNSTAGRRYDFVSQLFFHDALTDRVHAREPYAGRGPRDTRNNQDGIYRDGGRQLLLAPVRSGAGYAATLPIALALG